MTGEPFGILGGSFKGMEFLPGLHRPVGMIQVFVSRSISFHAALRTSPERWR
jgi:hypothetical protein